MPSNHKEQIDPSLILFVLCHMTFSFAKDEHLIYASIMGSRENGGATCKEKCWTLQKSRPLTLWASLGFA
jgi:hypothetical protein